MWPVSWFLPFVKGMLIAEVCDKYVYHTHMIGWTIQKVLQYIIHFKI